MEEIRRTKTQNKPQVNDAARWINEWSRLPLRGRLLLTVYMIIGAFGGLFGSHTVLSEFSHSWIAWAIALVVLEPVGLACGLGLVVLVFPESKVAAWFTSTVKRAKIASAVVGLVFL